ncbi:hypothetical protein [Funiculus sociatus]
MGNWELGIGDWELGKILPSLQSPVLSPQSQPPANVTKVETA